MAATDPTLVPGILDALYADTKRVSRLAIVCADPIAYLDAETDPELIRIFEALPSGDYSRPQLATALNAAFAEQGLTERYGLVG